MVRWLHCWNGCVPPPQMPMLSGTAASTMRSRISRICHSASSWLWQMPVAISIIDSVISGLMSPGVSLPLSMRSRSAEADARS